MQMRLIPTLVSIMQAPADKIPAGLCAVSASVGHGLGWRCSPFCNTSGGCSAKGRKAAVDMLWSNGFSHWGRFLCGGGKLQVQEDASKVCFKLLLWPSSSLHSVSRPQSFCCDIPIFQQEQSLLPVFSLHNFSLHFFLRLFLIYASHMCVLEINYTGALIKDGALTV